MVTWQTFITTAISYDLIWITIELTEILAFQTPVHKMNSNLMYRLQVKNMVVKTSDYQEGKHIELSRTLERKKSKECREIKSVPRSTRNHQKDRECLIVQQAATSCLCIVICWEKPSRFAATFLCVSSQWVFIVAHSKRDLQIFYIPVKGRMYLR